MEKVKELHAAAMFLRWQPEGMPSPDELTRTSETTRAQAEVDFYSWVATLPESLRDDARTRAMLLSIAYGSEAFERGFRAGINFMIQATQER